MAIVRLVEGRLAWYPPGASAEPQWLDDDAAREHLRATLAQRRIKVCFAVPGEDALLLTLSVTRDEKKHISKSLPFMLEEQVAADVDTLHFAYSPLQEDEFAVAIAAQEKMAAVAGSARRFSGYPAMVCRSRCCCRGSMMNGVYCWKQTESFSALASVRDSLLKKSW